MAKKVLYAVVEITEGQGKVVKWVYYKKYAQKMCSFLNKIRKDKKHIIMKDIND